MNTNPTINDIEREAVLAALTALHHGGGLTPAAVVAAAREATHPLHQYFEWDDARAGESYRIVQARALIRTVKLDLVRTNAASKTLEIHTTRAFGSRQSQRHAAGGYEPIRVILDDVDKRRELIATVLRELVAVRHRYAELLELESVWLAVDEVVSDLSDSPSTAPDGDARPGAAG